MRAFTTTIPTLVAAVMATIVAVTDPEPRTADKVVQAEHITGTGKMVEERFTYTIPRVTADLEGDLSPVGDGSTNRLHDFPAWEAALAQCREHPDRFNWRPYAIAVGFPEWVLDELAYVVQNESGGDLCARNPSSGAICWVQQISGEARFLDPATCMAIGYSKWVDGGRDFYKHWFRWWVR